MCSPKVISQVQRSLSRRNLLKLGAGAVAAATLPQTSSRARAQAAGMSLNNIQDLTHTLSPSFPVFPAFEPMKITKQYDVTEDGFYANRWDLGEHSGTHMDAPAHFVARAPTADQLPTERLFAPAVVIDISDKVARNADTGVSVADLTAWEDAHGQIPAGAAVLMRSGWASRLGEGDAFLNLDDAGTLHFPGFLPEAAEFLVSERTIVGVGVDTPSLDLGNSSTFDVHVTILGSGAWGLENLANLESLLPAGAQLIVGGPKVEGASGGPARVFAVWD